MGVARLTPMLDFAARRKRMDEVLANEGVDAMFLGLGVGASGAAADERVTTFLRSVYGWMCAGLAITAAMTIGIGADAAANPTTAFGGAYRLDALTTFLDLLFISIIAMTIVFAPDYLEPRGLPVAEFSVVLVFAMTGAMLIAASAAHHGLTAVTRNA